MKKFYIHCSLLLLLCLIVWHNSSGQRHEFGVGGGVMNYAGDLARGYPLNGIRPAGQAYYRYNINPIISLRAALSGGLLAGSDEYSTIDIVADRRDAAFNISVIEISGDFEFNFLDIKSEKAMNWWTPYLFVGIGGFYFNGDFPLNDDFSRFQPAVPFGGGVKMDVSKNLSISAEMGVRKLFTDHLDGVSEGDTSVKNYQYGNQFDKDWYNIFIFSVSYTLYTVDCPFDFY